MCLSLSYIMHVEMQLYFLLLNIDNLHMLINNCNMFVGSNSVI